MAFQLATGAFYDDTSTNGVSGKVLRLDPTSDGTHTHEAGEVKENGSGGSNFLAADTDGYTFLDASAETPTGDMEGTAGSLYIDATISDGDYVDQHFGRARYYKIYEIEDNKITNVEMRQRGVGHHNPSQQKEQKIHSVKMSNLQ